MKRMKSIFLCLFTLSCIAVLAACGSKAAELTQGQQTTGQQVQEQGQDGQAAGQEATAAQTDSPAATAEQEVVEQTLPSSDPNASIDSLLGKWVDISSADRFAEITKTDTGYLYKDNDGEYEASFAEGKLTVKVSEDAAADVHIDPATGHLLLIYDDNISEFSKK
jgi:uncharacterized iron-regulated membrane protein